MIVDDVLNISSSVGCVNVIRNFPLTLQVWGLFAPKFVFDVVGLIIMDVLVCLASLYYLGQVDNGKQQDHRITE